MGKSQTSDANQTAKAAQGQNQMQSTAAFNRNANYSDSAFSGDKRILGSNPFLDPAYIKNLNLLEGNALDAAKNDTNEALTNYGTRTGTNAAYIGASAKENARELARQGLSTRASQFAKDYGTWQQMRQQALNNMADLSGQQASLSTGQGSNANQSLSTSAKLSMQPGFWSQFGLGLLNAAGQAGSAAAGGAAYGAAGG